MICKKHFFCYRISTSLAYGLLYHRDMTIYGEYLFLENFIVGIVLLLLTAKLSGINTTPVRLLVGAALCGLGGFTVFLKAGPVWDAILRAGLLTAAVLCTFGKRKLLTVAGIFMVLTFLSGGIVMALLLWQHQPAVTHQGVLYIDIVTYSKLLCFGVLAFGFAYWFVKIASNRKNELKLRGRVKIIVDGREYIFEAFIDSGNSLVEPQSGKPVVLLDRKGQETFIKEDYHMERLAMIPFRTVGTDQGYLRAMRTDILTFNKKDFYGVYVAFFQGTFEGYEVLLSRIFLEGGLLENA